MLNNLRTQQETPDVKWRGDVTREEAEWYYLYAKEHMKPIDFLLWNYDKIC